jgi:hypothetical protein
VYCMVALFESAAHGTSWFLVHLVCCVLHVSEACSCFLERLCLCSQEWLHLRCLTFCMSETARCKRNELASSGVL